MRELGPNAPAPTVEAGADPSLRTRSALLTTVAWFRDLMLSVLIAVLVILFLYRPVKVEGTSMMPSLYDQERLFINQYSYKFGLGKIERGDTVVFWFPGDPTKSYIKRVIGLPGDTVTVDDGYVIVNGKKLIENYVPPEYRDDTSLPTRKSPQMSTSLSGIIASRRTTAARGLVPRSYIYGKAVFIFWPPDRVGTVRDPPSNPRQWRLNNHSNRVPNRLTGCR